MSVSEPTPSPAAQPQETVGSVPSDSETVGTTSGAVEVPPEPVPAAKKRGGLVRVVATVLVVVVVAIGGWFFSRDDASKATVGSCFAADIATEELSDASDSKTVDCAGSDAAFKVVGIVSDQLSSDLNPTFKGCDAFPTAESMLWLGEKGKKGKIYCLAPAKK